MQMLSALYYPHSEIRNENLIKQALLLWDSVEYIVPFNDYRFRSNNRDLEEAIDIVGVPRIVDSVEKAAIHDKVASLIADGLPDVFKYREKRNLILERNGVFAQKFLPRTWALIADAGLVGKREDDIFEVEENTALVLMSIVADFCAGQTKSRVTDRGAAYAAINNLLKKENTKLDNNLGVMVPMTLRVISASDFQLKDLIAFRKKEIKSRSSDLKDFRHNYVGMINKYIDEYKCVDSKSDQAELLRQFESKLNKDLKDLKHEIFQGKRDFVFSKEILVTVGVAIGSFVAKAHGVPFHLDSVLTAAGAPVAIGGPISAYGKYSSTVRKALDNHPMAYLYFLNRQ